MVVKMQPAAVTTSAREETKTKTKTRKKRRTVFLTQTFRTSTSAVMVMHHARFYIGIHTYSSYTPPYSQTVTLHVDMEPRGEQPHCFAGASFLFQKNESTHFFFRASMSSVTRPGATRVIASPSARVAHDRQCDGES